MATKYLIEAERMDLGNPRERKSHQLSSTTMIISIGSAVFAQLIRVPNTQTVIIDISWLKITQNAGALFHGPC